MRLQQSLEFSRLMKSRYDICPTNELACNKKLWNSWPIPVTLQGNVIIKEVKLLKQKKERKENTHENFLMPSRISGCSRTLTELKSTPTACKTRIACIEKPHIG